MAGKANANRIEVGTVLGQALALIVGIPTSTADAGPDTLLIWGNSTLNIDDRRLEGGLARLIPHGYCTRHVRAADWEPFVQRAIGLGCLR